MAEGISSGFLKKYLIGGLDINLVFQVVESLCIDNCILIAYHDTQSGNHITAMRKDTPEPHCRNPIISLGLID